MSLMGTGGKVNERRVPVAIEMLVLPGDYPDAYQGEF
jgi:hypothetical protein